MLTLKAHKWEKIQLFLTIQKLATYLQDKTVTYLKRFLKCNDLFI